MARATATSAHSSRGRAAGLLPAMRGSARDLGKIASPDTAEVPGKPVMRRRFSWINARAAAKASGCVVFTARQKTRTRSGRWSGPRATAREISRHSPDLPGSDGAHRAQRFGTPQRRADFARMIVAASDPSAPPARPRETGLRAALRLGLSPAVVPADRPKHGSEVCLDVPVDSSAIEPEKVRRNPFHEMPCPNIRRSQ